MAKDIQAEQTPQGLSYVSDRDPGLRRDPSRATGFNYRTAEGQPVTDEKTLDRIRVLAIPPAWTDVWISSDKAVFEFRGKSGEVHTTGFSDRRLAQVVKACQDLPGQRLFQYLDDDGRRRAVESADVNAYIRETLGEDFSAKDFRTWAGTVAAARTLASPECSALAGAPRGVNTCVKAVASLLANIAAVARSAYIHPAVLETCANSKLDLKPGSSARAFELAVLRFLEVAQ